MKSALAALMGLVAARPSLINLVEDQCQTNAECPHDDETLWCSTVTPKDKDGVEGDVHKMCSDAETCGTTKTKADGSSASVACSDATFEEDKTQEYDFEFLWTLPADKTADKKEGKGRLGFGKDGVLTFQGHLKEDEENLFNGVGKWSNFSPDLTNPDDAKYTKWGDDSSVNVYWFDKTNKRYFSSKSVTDKKIEGWWNNEDGSEQGAWTATVSCDWKCMAGQGFDTVSNTFKEGTSWLKGKIQGENGLAWALGSIGAVLAVCTGVYCLCCRKKEDLMTGGSEGGRKEYKKVLLQA